MTSKLQKLNNNEYKILIKKAIIFLIFSSLISVFIYPQFIFGIVLSEIFCFAALCPKPMIPKNKTIQNVIVYGIAGLLTILSIAFYAPINVNAGIILILFLLFSAISIHSLHYGTHWLCSVLAPIMSFICIEMSRGQISIIYNNIKLYLKAPADNYSLIVPYIISVLSLYAVLNLLFLLTKERRPAFLLFGFISIILCIVNAISVLLLGNVFSVSLIKGLAEAIKASGNTENLFSVSKLLSPTILSPVVFSVVYFPTSNRLTSELGYITKREKVVKLFLSLFIILSIILISNQVKDSALQLNKDYIFTWLFSII